MGEMISMIAHQWRQPLNAISVTTANLTLKLMMDNIDKKVFQKSVEQISQYSQHLSNTIDFFRGFFKNNKQTQETTLEEIVNNTLGIVKMSMNNKNITINTEFGCHVRMNIYANEIQQVVLNLLQNAEEVLLEKQIQKPIITIQTIKDGINSILIVKDNARGVSKEMIDKIFDPYFSTKLEKNGTGLGLYMSKMIIEDHCNGKLSVSNDDNGAVFKIVL